MEIDSEKVFAAFRKLEKSIRGMPRNPSPKRVHNLRTRIRKTEAVAQALLPKSRLQKALKPIRKRAGDVRDMDVLIALAASLQSANDSQVQLIEYLDRQRTRAARRLRKLLSRKKKAIRNELRRCSTRLRKEFSKSGSELSANAFTMTYSLWVELQQWPPLDKNNLHPFRLKVKPLRYLLETVQNPNAKLLEALGVVKDAIGEWHDWQTLESVAGDLLQPEAPDSPLIEIRSTTRSKLQHALQLTREFRKKHIPRKINRRSAPQGHPGEIQNWQQVQIPAHLLPIQHARSGRNLNQA